MSINHAVDLSDAITNITTFFIMLAFVSWNLYKYKLNASDKFFIFALCMYPLAYLFLMIGAILYLLEDKLYDDELYSFINLRILPFNYLVMWSIELMLTFEMQLMRVRLESDDPKAYRTKLKKWKIFRFFTLFASTIMSALQMFLTT